VDVAVKLGRKILLVVLLTVLIATTCGWLYIRTSLPKTRGIVTLANLDGQVEVVRDPDGVPHIFAATNHDAFLALGYVHAQDRMWQMEMQRRIAAGQGARGGRAANGCADLP